MGDSLMITKLEAIILDVLRELADQSAACDGHDCAGHPVESMVAEQGIPLAFHSSSPLGLAAAIAARLASEADRRLALVSSQG